MMGENQNPQHHWVVILEGLDYIHIYIYIIKFGCRDCTSMSGKFEDHPFETVWGQFCKTEMWMIPLACAILRDTRDNGHRFIEFVVRFVQK